jgi:hypothetical protein
MIKKNLILLVLSLGISASSQSLYYDAWTLKKDLSGNICNLQTHNLLIQYLNIDTTGISSDSVLTVKINEKLKQNPFLKDFQTSQISKLRPNIAEPNTSATTPSGLDATTIVGGMANFLVKRAKQELAITFFNKFKETISNTNYRDLQSLFPSTYTTLNAISDEIYYYEAYIQTLRESFEKDLSELPDHLPSIIDNDPIFFQKHKDLEALLKSGCYIADELNNKQHPGAILRDYPIDYLNILDPNWEGSLQTLQLISESLRDKVTSQDSASYWVSLAQVKNLINDQIVFKIYLGLIYQQAKTIIFKNGISLNSILDAMASQFNENYLSYSEYFSNIAEQTNTLSTIVKAFKKSAPDSVSLQQYAGFVDAITDFLESAGDINKLVPQKFKQNLSGANSAFFADPKKSLSPYFDLTRASMHLIVDIKGRNYASAIVDVITIWDNTYSFVRSDNTDSASWKNAHKVISCFMKYGTFAATIVQAKNSDDVENAIEAVALPAGSASIKRNSWFNVSLNAYVGGFYGWERDQVQNQIFNWNPITGISAPIGVAFSTSWPTYAWLIPEDCGGFFKPGWPWMWWLSGPYYFPQLFSSASLFGSIVDIGAITAYSFQNDSASKLPDFNFQNILAPGLHIILGIRNCPISVGYGWQIGPQLRAITDSTTTINNSHGFRQAAFVAVDIPIVDFFTIPRKEEKSDAQ